MLCPVCNGKTTITETRMTADGIRRRKECKCCSMRFTTYEILDEVYEDMVKEKHRVLEKAKVYINWSKDEDEKLIQLRQKGLTRTDIAIELGRTKASIKNRIQDLEVRK